MITLNTGDILFYAGNRNKFIDRLIMDRTKSDVVHVAVKLPSGNMIQAKTGGVVITPTVTPAYVATTGEPLRTADAVRFLNALAALEARVGQTYGFGDLVNQLVILLPGHPSLSLDRSWDCSHLAAVWLDAAGYDLPFDTEAARVSPGDLKRILSPVPYK